MIVRVTPTMGTVASFHVFAGEQPEQHVTAAVEAACSRLEELENIFSTWKHDSPMNQLRAGRLDLEETFPEIHAVLELCGRAKEMSKGWFDPWAMPGGVDPTGLVKGWAVEQALSLLRDAEVAAAMVNAGGDIATLGLPPGELAWRIGIRHPWKTESLACVLLVESAVATSGCYERGAHLIDPRDMSSTSRAASATVTGGCLAIADALATALAVAGDEGLEIIRSIDGYEAYLIRPDGTEEATDGIFFAGDATAEMAPSPHHEGPLGRIEAGRLNEAS